MAKKPAAEPAADEKTVALTVLKDNNFMVAELNAESFALALRENFGNEKLGQQDLDKIKIPSGDMNMFMVPDLEEGEKAVKTIMGVIVYYRPGRAYWEKSMDDGGSGPPDCYSNDGLTGIGAPSGDCAMCPFNQFESAAKGKGKACNERKLLFFMMPDSVMPRVVSLPPTSLGAFKKYLTRLTSGIVPYPAVVTEIGLTPKTNSGGQAYHEASFRMVKKMTKADIEHMRTIIEPLRGAFDAQKMTERDG